MAVSNDFLGTEPVGKLLRKLAIPTAVSYTHLDVYKRQVMAASPFCAVLSIISSERHFCKRLRLDDAMPVRLSFSIYMASGHIRRAPGALHAPPHC